MTFMPLTQRESASRFWAKVARDSTGCWIWMGHRKPSGYGVVKRGNKETGAHRFAWRLTHGPILPGLLVCHHCDNPPCVNPAHLFVGTDSDNHKDMLRKGRWQRLHPIIGSAVHCAKLSDDKVLEIRKRVAAGERQIDVAPEFGVSSAIVSEIMRRKIWKHLPPGPETNYKPCRPVKAQNGETNDSAKLSEDNVREIRSLSETMTQQAIANQFGITQGNVWCILARRTWRHI